MNAEARLALAFPTGLGQSETRAVTLNDGRQNPHKSAGTPYDTISGREIAALLKNPQEVQKERARWFLPSTYADHDARDHSVQRECGLFWWLTVDADTNDLCLDDIEEALEAVAPGATRLVYATRSSRPGDRRWRALLPLAEPITGTDYTDTATAFYALLEDASAGTLIPDRKLSLPGQLVYLPNRGEHFEASVTQGKRLLLAEEHPIARRRDDERRRIEAAKAAATEGRERRRSPPRREIDEKPVDLFNVRYSVAEMLARYGYEQLGQSCHWRSPLQSSRTFATRDFGSYWVTLSGSDAAAGIGAETTSGARHGDAFDLFVHFEHGGDFNRAVRAYAEEAGLRSASRECDTGGPPGQDDRPGPGHNGSDEIDLSHDSLALELGKRSWDRNARHVASWGKWLFWTGTRWEVDEQLSHMTRVRRYLRDRAEELVDWAERKAAELDDKEGDGKGDKLRAWAKAKSVELRSKTTVAAVETMARSNRSSVAAPGAFDGGLLSLGTPDGTVDLPTGEIAPARREDMITKLTAVGPAPRGTVATRWTAFLDEIFGGDQQIIDFMQCAAGYALTGLTTEHKLLFLYGTGRNGKSTFLDILTWLMADYARRAPAATFLNSSVERHPTDIAGLQGARLVVGSELPKGRTWDESVIKDLTGGDRMTARFMRGDFFDFTPQLTLMIAGNNMPSFRGVDDAIRARVVLVPFAITIPPEKRDKGLTEKLKAEGPAILRWAIEGAIEWRRRGLDVPAKVAAASDDYLNEEDVLGQFLADNITSDSSAFTTTSDITQRFRQWAEAQGLHAWTSHTLTKELKSRGFQDARRTYGRGFLGIRLT